MFAADEVKALALESGFELAGVVRAEPAPDAARYLEWVRAGMAGEMSYLTDHRAEKRLDPRSLLASAKSILCVGKVYNGPEPYTREFTDTERAWIARYAWGEDYHDVLRTGLAAIAARLSERAPAIEYKICVDTAPLLERTYARLAGLGWIGKNTCLINERKGSWLFLGELLLSVELEPDQPVEERCGSCTACIDACPTNALADDGLDSRRCISYLTIELRGPLPIGARTGVGRHVFGCDICQDVCPWNRRPAISSEPRFASRHVAPPLERLAALNEDEFRAIFRSTPITRARYSGFLRNVVIAMGNAREPRFIPMLEGLREHSDATVSEHAAWALERLATEGVAR